MHFVVLERQAIILVNNHFGEWGSQKNSQSFSGKAGEMPGFSGILHVSVKWRLAVHDIVLSAIVTL